MVQALNTKLRQLLERDPKIVLFGEDIEDPKGGVFGLTKGLSSCFPDRVRNSPLAEATIAGVGAGMALVGYHPVFEIQFIDFVGAAFHQLANQIATMRWRSNGDWKCPLVILAPCGGYLPAGGIWHSQSNEAWFAHIPGLQVVVPSTPFDAAALLELAATGEDPVLMLLPKHQFRARYSTRLERPIAIGQAALRRPGDDVTVVAWGNCVAVALEAAALLAREQIDVEVVDLVSLAPCDWNTIQRSIRTTGRLVVIEEDNRTCSFGQAIVAQVTSDPAVWSSLKKNPLLIARADVHIPFHPKLERAVLPDAARAAAEIHDLVRNR